MWSVIVNSAGWLIFGVFLLIPIIIFGGIYLTRDKKEKPVKDSSQPKSFTRSKKDKKSLIVKENTDVAKEDVVAGVFGFGQNNGFSMPTANLENPAPKLNPELMSTTSEPAVKFQPSAPALPPQGTPEPARFSAPQEPVTEPAPVKPAPPKFPVNKGTLPPPPPSLK